MRAFTLKLSAIFLMVISSAFCFDNSLAAQDWNGRRYITEDLEVCHQMILKLLAKDKSFSDAPAVEKEAVVALLAMTDIKIGMAFKSKNRFVSTVMMSINNSLAHKASMGREQIEEANSMLMQLSADMKTSGTYTIEGKNLNIKDDTNKETVTFTLLEDGQKIQATEDGITIVFKRLK